MLRTTRTTTDKHSETGEIKSFIQILVYLREYIFWSAHFQQISSLEMDVQHILKYFHTHTHTQANTKIQTNKKKHHHTSTNTHTHRKANLIHNLPTITPPPSAAATKTSPCAPTALLACAASFSRHCYSLHTSTCARRRCTPSKGTAPT